MELKDVIEEAKEKTGLNQDELAKRIGIDRTALSHALHGRRKLKAEAAIELFDITGIHPKKILAATARTAACIALAVVVIFSTAGANPAYASMAYEAGNAGNTKYGGFISRRFRMLFAFLRHHLMPSPNGRLALGIA